MTENLSLKELKAKNESEVDNKLDNEQDHNDDVQNIIEDGTDELESWQQTEEATSDDKKSGFVPNHEAAKRRKQVKSLRGELDSKNTELEDLRKKVDALTSTNQQTQHDELEPRPTREDFNYDDDAYDVAIDNWNDKKLDIKLEKLNQKNSHIDKVEIENQQRQQYLSQSLDDHYGRASKLIESGKITEESYRNADKVVRMSMDNIFPDQGDQMTDALIATLNRLGDGSEKVMYQLGVNSAKMQKLQQLLTEDSTGLSASAFLGNMQATISSNTKRNSQAPAPSSNVSGENVYSGNEGLMKKEYEKATSVQQRITLKRQAKRNGIDTKKW